MRKGKSDKWRGLSSFIDVCVYVNIYGLLNICLIFKTAVICGNLFN